jgi:hypothetical protein
LIPRYESFLSVILSLEANFPTLFVLAYLHEKIDKLIEGHYALLENTQKLLERQRRLRRCTIHL